MTIKSVKKFITILKIYDYFSELKSPDKRIPTIYEVIYNFDENKRYMFCEFIIDNLRAKNVTFLDVIEENLPELELSPIRRFRDWMSYEYLNETSIDDWESESNVDFSKMITPRIYPEF